MSQAFPATFIEPYKVMASKLDGPGKQALKSLHAKGYEVYVGLDEAYARQIVTMAKQPSIREYCPNDIGSRFKSVAAARTWQSKKRAPFLLVTHDAAKTLAGYGWSGQGKTPEIPDSETTFALRVSEKHQGKGLATPYAQVVLSASKALFGAQNIWLEAWQSNGGAVHVYTKLGAETVTKQPTTRPTIAGGTVEDVRLHMQLPNTYNGVMQDMGANWRKVPSTIRKPLVFMVGSAVIIAGVVMLVFPGPGWAGIFLGFAILATEFAFAEKVRDWLVNAVKQITRELKQRVGKGKQ